MAKRGQGAFEYILMLGGLIMVVTIILVALQGASTSSTSQVRGMAGMFCAPTDMGRGSAGLVASWHFDEGGGTVAVDSSGNGNTGTMAGNPAIATGKMGTARSFSADADAMGVPSVPLGASWTIEGWFSYPIQPSHSGWWRTFARGLNGDLLAVSGTGSDVLAAFQAPSTPHYTSYAVTGLSNGWHHMAAVGAGTTTTFYMDGNQVATADYRSTSPIVYVGNYGGLAQQFGTIDEVKIYDRALSQAEIQADMNCFSGLGGS